MTVSQKYHFSTPFAESYCYTFRVDAGGKPPKEETFELWKKYAINVLGMTFGNSNAIIVNHGRWNEGKATEAQFDVPNDGKFRATQLVSELVVYGASLGLTVKTHDAHVLRLDAEPPATMPPEVREAREAAGLPVPLVPTPSVMSAERKAEIETIRRNLPPL